MKIFNKILAGVVSAAVIVLALAVPTAAVLPTTPKTDSKSGRFTLGNKSYSYSGKLVASATQASATASSGKGLNLGVSLNAYAISGGITYNNNKSDAISGTQVSVSTDNTFTVSGKPKILNIENATAKCTISTIATLDLEVK